MFGHLIMVCLLIIRSGFLTTLVAAQQLQRNLMWELFSKGGFIFLLICPLTSYSTLILLFKQVNNKGRCSVKLVVGLSVSVTVTCGSYHEEEEELLWWEMLEQLCSMQVFPQHEAACCILVALILEKEQGGCCVFTIHDRGSLKYLLLLQWVFTLNLCWSHHSRFVGLLVWMSNNWKISMDNISKYVSFSLPCI